MTQLGLGLDLSTKRTRKREFLKTRYRGLMKNTAQITTLFVLGNLWMARKALRKA